LPKCNWDHSLSVKYSCKEHKTQPRINNLQPFLTANSSKKAEAMHDAPDDPAASVAKDNAAMTEQIDAVIERTERLLLRHEELSRTNALLLEQVNALTHERDTLKSRLAAARSRIDALIERLPEQPVVDASAS
jgi:cell division protein ZapB